VQGKFHFIDGTTVDIGPEIPDKSQHVYIGECFAGIKKYRIGVAEGILQFRVLFFNFLSMVNIKRGPIFIGYRYEVGVGKRIHHVRNNS